MDEKLSEAIQILEEDADQLEKWAEATRFPMGAYSILGEKMIARAKVIRDKITLLKTQTG